MAPNEKWTRDGRLFLYARVLEEFGPLSTWESTFPNEGGRNALLELFEQIRPTLSEMMKHSDLKATAIENQFKWAYTNTSISDKSGLRNYILNVAAALDAKWMRSKDLPNEIRVRTDSAEA